MKKAAGDYDDTIAHLYDLRSNKDIGFDYLACVQWGNGWRERCLRAEHGWQADPMMAQ